MFLLLGAARARLLLDLLPSQTCCCVLQFILTVELVRVGTYAMLPNASLTPRSLIPLEGDVSEREELSKISGLMIYVCHARHLCTPSLRQNDLCHCQQVKHGLVALLITCQPVQRWVCWCCRSGSTLWTGSGRCVSR